MTTSNTNNQGIIHLAYQFGGRPFCGSKRAIMVTIPAEAHKWPRICARCLRIRANQGLRRSKAEVHQ